MSEPLTLRRLVLEGQERLPERSRAPLRGSKAIEEVGRTLRSSAGAAGWVAGLEGLEACVLKALDLEVSDLIAGAWNTKNRVLEAMRVTADDPEREEAVPLLSHTIESKHRPTIEVSIDHVPLPAIPFDLIVELDLEGAILTIRNGRIDRIQPGSCKGTVSLELQGAVLISKESGAFVLPGSLTLRPSRESPAAH